MGGASLDAQEAAVVAAAEAAGYRVEVVREEGRSAKDMKRPALQEALKRLDRGEAQALYAQRLDRLSRSVADFAGLLERSQRRGWTVKVLDADVDTSTPSGEFLVSILASAAQFERRLVSARTKDALAQRRREGKRLGRPSTLSLEVVARVVELREEGRSLREIAATMEAEGHLPARAEKWHHSAVAKVLRGQDAQRLQAA